MLVNLYKKIISFFQEKIIPHCSNHNKYFRFFIIILGFLFFCLTAFYDFKDRKIWQDDNIFRNGDTLQKIKNIFNKDEIEKYQLGEKNDQGEKEQTFIILKGMFMGIIIFSILLGLKKGLTGISLGVFIGSFVGVWISILIPSFIYFLEFIFAGKIFL